MGYSTSNQGRPIQGISQQPPKTRHPGQCTDSANMKPDLVKGLTSRPGTSWMKDLDPTPLTSEELKDPRIKWHQYDRGDGREAYVIAILPEGEEFVDDDWPFYYAGQVLIWHRSNLTPFPITVTNFAGATDYLTCPNPREQIKCQTIGDYTFLVNTTKEVEPAITLTDSPDPEGLIYVQFMDYGQTVSVFLDFGGSFQQVAWYASGDGAAASHKPGVNVENITSKLYEALTGGASTSPLWSATWGGVNITSEYTVLREANTIRVERIDNGDFALIVDDDADGKNSVAIKNQLSDVTKLPSRAPDGFLVEIDPPGGTTADNAKYWLKAERQDSNYIKWVETTAPGIVTGFDKTTMPHVLVRTQFIYGEVGHPDGAYNAKFDLRAGEWKDRLVGDDDSNPLPTFVNTTDPQTIELVGQAQNRLFFTSRESVIMTRTGDFFDFFRESAQQALDTDPIDIFADVPQINYLKAVKSFDGDLVFFSDNGQFIMSGAEPLTPSTATLRQATTFDCNLEVNPVASGDNIFFTYTHGEYLGIREFFTDSITDTKRARPITDHVNEFIPNDPYVMKSATNIDQLMVMTGTNRNILYVYDWLWQGTDKVQSAWGKYIFPEEDMILDFDYDTDALWLVMHRADEDSIYLERMDLGDSDESILDFAIKADKKVYSAFSDQGSYWESLYDDPYPNLDLSEIHVINRNGTGADVVPGEKITVYREGGKLRTTQVLDGTETFAYVLIGQKFECLYEPTNPVYLDENGESLGLDSLVVNNFYMNYITSGIVEAEVARDNGESHTYVLTPRILGSLSNTVGAAELSEGRHKVGIRQRSDKYKLTYRTTSHYPLQVRDFEFNAIAKRRGRRI